MFVPLCAIRWRPHALSGYIGNCTVIPPARIYGCAINGRGRGEARPVTRAPGALTSHSGHVALLHQSTGGCACAQSGVSSVVVRDVVMETNTRGFHFIVKAKISKVSLSSWGHLPRCGMYLSLPTLLLMPRSML